MTLEGNRRNPPIEAQRKPRSYISGRSSGLELLELCLVPVQLHHIITTLHWLMRESTTVGKPVECVYPVSNNWLIRKP